MISTIYSTAKGTTPGVQYVIWSKELAGCNLTVSITNGVDAYKSEACINVQRNKPKSNADTDEKWWSALLSAVQAPESANHEFDIVPRDGGCDMVIYSKESSQTRIKLAQCALTTMCGNGTSAQDDRSSIMAMFSLAGTELKAQRELVATLRRDNEVIAQQNRALEGDVLAWRRDKDSWQDDMCRKMCLLINAKKREIERLESLIKLDKTKSDMISTHVPESTAALPATGGAARTARAPAARGRPRKRKGIDKDSESEHASESESTCSGSDDEALWADGVEDEVPSPVPRRQPARKRSAPSKPAKAVPKAVRAARSKQLIENRSVAATSSSSASAAAAPGGDDLDEIYRKLAESSQRSNASAPSPVKSASLSVASLAHGEVNVNGDAKTVNSSPPAAAVKTRSLLASLIDDNSGGEDVPTQIVGTSPIRTSDRCYASQFMD